jgi:aldose 1-epimerase
MFKTTFLILLILAVIACQPKPKEAVTETINFEINVRNIKMGDQDAQVFNLKNGNGMEVELTNYGGILSRILVPDKDGNSENIMLTYNQVEDFINDRYFFGATAGRYANRIAKGKFSIDGTEYQLATNNGPNHLHGGLQGFNKKFWKASVIDSLENAVGVKMEYLSVDGEEGYPGNLNTTMTFILDQENKLSITMESTTDKPTIVNLTHHGYFNLSGMKEDILGHQLTIFAEHYTPVDAELIPTGELAPVEGTAFDFRTPHRIGDRIADTGAGYDHNFVIKKEHDGKLSKMAELVHSGTGRTMTVYSSMPGVQFYSGNFLDGKQTTAGVTYGKNFGMCLEPQFFPNSPNQPNFPSPRLNPGETYRHEIVYEFGVKQ